MKKISVIAGIAILAVVLISFKTKHKHHAWNQKIEHKVDPISFAHLFAEGLKWENELALLEPNDIKVIEVEEDIEFDFDVTSYLPEGFNPYKHMNVEVKKHLTEEEEALLSKKEIEQLFAEGIQWEKEAFQLSADDIHVIEVEEEIDVCHEKNNGRTEVNSHDVNPTSPYFTSLELEKIYHFYASDTQNLDFQAELQTLGYGFSAVKEAATFLSADDIHVFEVEEDVDLGVLLVN
ncbi:hypothetical protein U1E44_02800 [Arenibacter sp. GZD96]|uniref:hypothetical protein n=1 Tax=Aurantibrevibacter litoralis TaxID=3106030 RepID=UPI002B00082B|nr:hypothetical protein [Arenibacter sp. GZD-96]MEA1785009.1 hypothetical protein [Arenibacter sp. GZD-96]